MKKVLALALALGMALSMTSMAALEFKPVNNNAHPPKDADMYPGETYKVEITGWTFSGDHTEKDYSLSVDWSKGSALVDSAKLMKREKGSDQMKFELKLKENYTIDEAKDLVGTLTLKEKFGDKNTHKLELRGTVSNDVVGVDGASKRDDATAVDVEDNTIYKMDNSGWVEFCGDGNRLSSVKVRLPEDKKVFAYFNEDSIDEVEDKYYDLDADISYVNFVAKPNLGQKADIAIQGDYSSKYYLYEYENGKLNEIDAKWNEDDGLFEFKASKLGAYVISSKALVAKSDKEESKTEETADKPTESKNPDTGANDVVGVAVALAAVSLVAAGAVTLKK